MTSTADFRRIFVDSSAWISLMNRKERHHEAAVEFHHHLRPLTLRVTSWGVVSETFTWLRYHVGDREALQWLAMKEMLENQGFLQIIYPDAVLEPRIRRVIDHYQDKDISYVDAHIIAVARAHPEINAIFAFDRHMLLAGLPVLPGLLN
jgi:predicted nucleic acid-binding protein